MKRQKFARSKRAEPPKQRLVIACEGSRTEPKYFDGIKNHLQLRTATIEIVPHIGTDPLTVVDAVVAYVAAARVRKQWLPTDQAWAVFDGEEHWTGSDAKSDEVKKNQWNTAIQRANAKGICLAISNPSFELWYLLHFQSQTADLNRDAAVAKLKLHVPDYDKSTSLFPLLHPKVGKNLTSDAIARAAALCGHCSATGWEQWRNPSTRVGELVNALLSLAK